MSVTRIDSHPKFSRNKPSTPVEHDPIVTLDGHLSANEFMKETFEWLAVKKFLCDMGFAIVDNKAEFISEKACFSIELPPTFNSLSFACGFHGFHRHGGLSKDVKVMIGKLGVASNLAGAMWKSLVKQSVA
jgi:hypothetical protein